LSDHGSEDGSNGSCGVAAAFEDLFLSTDVVEEFLRELVLSAATAVGGQVSTAITLELCGRPVTRASSDERAAEYDEVQYAYNEGPSLTAMRARMVILIEDVARDERFSQYRPRALALGLRSSLSWPLDGGDRCVGVLSLYSPRAHAFGPDELADAQRFADEAYRALSMTLRLVHNIEITEELRTALTSRTAVNEATGVTMYEHRCDAEVALALLRAASRDRKLSLDLVASEIVIGASGTPPLDGFRFRV
jgi:GAF domain-containing protein